MNDEIVRFWDPAPQAATGLACAYLETGQSRPHVHEEWQFGVPDNPAKLSVGAFRRHTAHATDVAVVAPYEVHAESGAIGATPKWRMLFVAPSLLAPLYRALTSTTGRERPRIGGGILTDPPGALELRALLRDSEQRRIEGTQFMSRALRWLEQLLHRHAAGAASPARTPAVERARVYLRDRATQPVRLAEVGAAAGVTVSHLVRSFSRAVGLPPMSYHAQVRLARARRLLAEGKSATWVAYECGFADQSHLSRRYKEYCGLTPGAFQSQYRREPCAADGLSEQPAALDSNAA